MLKPVIQAAIQRRMADREKRTEITHDRVLQEYACLAFNDPRQYFNESGDLVPISELSQEAAAAISGFDARVVKGEDGTECTIMKIKLSDKRASLNDVARHLGMFLEDNKQKGPSEILVTLEPDND
jgi:phage terminase small subunit